MFDFVKNNPESYKKLFGDKEMENLTSAEFRQLFHLATTHDSIHLSNQKDF